MKVAGIERLLPWYSIVNAQSDKTRQSNLELLRIIATLMVLVAHANYLSIGIPLHDDIYKAPISSFFRIEIELMCMICVNLFVLISGYFGIKWSLKGILHLLFQIYFWNVIIYLILHFTGTIDITGYKTLFVFAMKNWWFVEAYLTLWLVSPILNRFTVDWTKQQARLYLLIAWSVISIGWFVPHSHFIIEEDTFLFINLYLTGRYIAQFGINFRPRHKATYLLIYVTTSVLVALIIMAIIATGLPENQIRSISDRYITQINSPIYIVEAICVFLYFKDLHFNNKYINYIAVSTFAVYLIHSHPRLIIHYMYTSEYIYKHFDTLSYIPLITLFILTTFCACLLLDQIRIFAWNLITYWMTKKREIKNTPV